MGESARIYDSRALLDMKAALVEFAESISAALGMMDADISRMSMWLSQERPAHWKAEIRKRDNKLVAAKTEISRKIIAAAPEPPSLVLERRTVLKCQNRLEEARRRYEKVRMWAPRWERDALLYKGSTQAISIALSRDIPLAMARLERMLLAIEAYARMSPQGSEDMGQRVSETEGTSDGVSAPEVKDGNGAESTGKGG